MHLRSVNIEGLGCFFLSAQSKGETPNPGVDRVTMMKHRTRQYNGKVR